MRVRNLYINCLPIRLYEKDICTDGYWCFDGACQAICEDSDGGRNIVRYGEVYYGKEVYVDVCVNENAVNEQFCIPGGPSAEVIGCGPMEQCSRGRCTPMIVE